MVNVATKTVLPQHRRASQPRRGSRLRRGSGFSIGTVTGLFSTPRNSYIEEEFEDQPTASAERTQEERAYIQSILKTNYLFQDHIHECSLVYLSSAFTKAEYQQGDVIFVQGDTTDKDEDYMLILEEGECSITIDGVVVPDPYGTIGRGAMVGELALIMESKRRSATVTAKTNVVAFRLDKASFKRFMAGPHERVDDIKAEMRQIDQVIDKISGVKKSYGGDIIRQFKPSRAWLWGRWSGTILQQAGRPAAAMALLTALFVVAVRYCTEPTWALGQIPDPKNPFISRLVPLAVLWKYLMNITTFILTFFLAQAYTMWRKMYDTCRKIQGRMSDLVLLVAATVERDENDKLSEKAETLVDDIGHYVRLFHVFNWACYSKKFAVISTDRGLSRMLSRGLISRKEYNTLTSLRPTGGPHHTCLMWVLVRVLSAMKNGTLPNDRAVREVLFEKVCVLIALYTSIPSQLHGRIPLSYVHIVQLLVDTFLLIAPFALYTEMGIWSIPAVGLLTLFYAGLLVLSKVLLDPLDNDEYYAETVNMDIGVLIRESNNGSVRWKYNAEVLPFSTKEC